MFAINFLLELQKVLNWDKSDLAISKGGKRLTVYFIPLLFPFSLKINNDCIYMIFLQIIFGKALPLAFQGYVRQTNRFLPTFYLKVFVFEKETFALSSRHKILGIIIIIEKF